MNLNWRTFESSRFDAKVCRPSASTLSASTLRLYTSDATAHICKLFEQHGSDLREIAGPETSA